MLVEKKYIKALSYIMSTDDTRFWLNGIFIDSVNKYMVATNGNMLLAIRQETGLSYSGIIPANIINTAKPTMNRYDINIDKNGSIMFNDIMVKCVGGTFPNWKKLLDSKETFKESRSDIDLWNIDLSLLLPIQKAVKCLTGDSVCKIKREGSLFTVDIGLNGIHMLFTGVK